MRFSISWSRLNYIGISSSDTFAIAKEGSSGTEIQMHEPSIAADRVIYDVFDIPSNPTTLNTSQPINLNNNTITSASTEAPHQPWTDALIGTVVGAAISGLITTVILIWFLFRNRKQKRNQQCTQLQDKENVIPP